MYTEGYAKRLMRLDLYLHVQRRLSKPARAGAVVVLAGPSAGEIGVIRHILRTRPHRTWFVDTLEEGLQTVRARWPEAHTYCGDVRCALDDIATPIGFIHLDTMHQFTKVVRETLKTLRRKVVSGGIIAFAYSRRGLDKQENFVAQMLNALGVEGLGIYSPILIGKYNGNSSMGLSVIQRAYRGHVADCYWPETFSDATAECVLRREANCGLLRDRYTTKQIEEILHIDERTLAQWWKGIEK